MSVKEVCEVPEVSTANDPEPVARYTLYPVIVTPEPVGATQFKPTWTGFPVPLSPRAIVGFVDALLVTVS